MGLAARLGIRHDSLHRNPVGERAVHINDSAKNAAMYGSKNNKVSTSKYTLVSFLPRFIYEQVLKKYANLFFLVTGSIQTIKDITPISQYGTLLPLTVILIFTGIKEVIEDQKRHFQDRLINTCKVLVLQSGKFVTTQWRHVKMGDIVKVVNKEFFPADLVLISSSEDDGQCYIETSQLDGETNLKIRQAIPETSTISTAQQLESLQGVITTELPNNSLYTFDATLQLAGQKYPLAPDQLLLRVFYL